MPGDKSLAREYLEALLIAVLFATFARTFVVQAFKIPSGSMENNLLIGDHILVNKFVFAPRLSELETHLLPMRNIRRGDVVVFKFPEDPSRDFIKRCIGTPRDTIRMVGRDLYLNGKPVEERGYVHYAEDDEDQGASALGRRHWRQDFGPTTVPARSYFCLGDNRDNSNDSRYWGTVPAPYVKGRALLVYWSVEGGEGGNGDSLEWPGWRRRLQQIGSLLSHFASRTRWSRTLRIVR